MALQSSGQISLSNIATEKGASTSHISLANMNLSINNDSPSKPNTSTPHAMSEWYGYDHTYTSGPPPVDVTPIIISGFAMDPGEACSIFETLDLFKTGERDIIQEGDVLYTDEGGTEIYLQDNQEATYSTYFNNDFGKIVFQYADGVVQIAFVDMCRRR